MPPALKAGVIDHGRTYEEFVEMIDPETKARSEFLMNSLFILLLLLLAGGYSAALFHWFGAKWTKTPKVLGCILAPLIVLSSVHFGLSIGVDVAFAISGPGPEGACGEWAIVPGTAGIIGGSCIGGLVGCLATITAMILFSRIWKMFATSRS